MKPREQHGNAYLCGAVLQVDWYACCTVEERPSGVVASLFCVFVQVLIRRIIIIAVSYGMIYQLYQSNSGKVTPQQELLYFVHIIYNTRV